ncbi:MAG: Mut7-C RNAse domain-containing protein [Phycisphaerales bacterium]|nr:MAG: Mut7-C RNAse domain-containing protein [Phycisphaerales bacterium]
MVDSNSRQGEQPGGEAGASQVSCADCGRAYPREMFAYGRTIHCACGARVGTDPQPRPGCGEASGMRFFVDVMLGRLARWLRILGFDTAYEEDIEDEDLIRCAVDERRIILTRDRLMPEQWRVDGIHLVNAEEPMAQLREVADAFGLAETARPFTRCSQCNALLSEASEDEVAVHVPADVLEAVKYFKHCPGCDRFYWEGSHVKRMRRMLDRALGW